MAELGCGALCHSQQQPSDQCEVQSFEPAKQGGRRGRNHQHRKRYGIAGLGGGDNGDSYADDDACYGPYTDGKRLDRHPQQFGGNRPVRDGPEFYANGSLAQHQFRRDGNDHGEYHHDDSDLTDYDALESEGRSGEESTERLGLCAEQNKGNGNQEQERRHGHGGACTHGCFWQPGGDNPSQRG